MRRCARMRVVFISAHGDCSDPSLQAMCKQIHPRLFSLERYRTRVLSARHRAAFESYNARIRTHDDSGPERG